MSYALTLAAAIAAGLALLDLLRLRTRAWVPDLALGWLAGTGWLAAVLPALRFGLGIPLGRLTLAAVVLAPVAAWAALRWRRRAAGPGGGGPGEPSGAPGEGARWVPRPRWLFAPIALHVVVVTAAVLLHGSNTPTHTDDAVRVRAFAPMLAFDDRWEPEARSVFAIAGPLTTFVPATGWIASGTVDHFHVNYAVLTELLALLALAVGLASARGAPERGWAAAFAVLSLPLLVYHCTSTYSDAVLALRSGGALLLAIEYARGRDRRDLSRAFLLVGIAALVKREGELVAAAVAAVLVAQLAWERWREGRALPWAAAGLLAAPGLVAAAGKVAALGLAGAFPLLGFVADRGAQAIGVAGAAPRQPGMIAEAARVFLDDALFRSGNQGMLYWALLAVIAVRARALLRGELAWPLLAVGALFGEVAVSSIFLAPEYTLDQGTVNRALLVVSVPAALWLATAVVEAVSAERLAETAAPADEPRARGGAAGGEGAATPPRRRRPRQGRRR